MALAAKRKCSTATAATLPASFAALRDDFEQEAYCRLLPGYVRHFVENAAPLVGIQIEGNLDGCFSLPACDQRRRRSAGFTRWRCTRRSNGNA